MKRTAWLAAVVLSAGLSTGAFAEITGSAKLDGKAPKRTPVPGVASVPQCAALHKDPLLDEKHRGRRRGQTAKRRRIPQGRQRPQGQSPQRSRGAGPEGLPVRPARRWT